MDLGSVIESELGQKWRYGALTLRTRSANIIGARGVHA